ncbi:ABC transporter permease [Actinoplanes sp. LDG1-06]|uniref:ABC transporter permease n=1 Tax=Paractinoplanes ovalisporus TaxID=2810368 RepID=A0ABS2AES7_9ACTN|nr:ABC transporter permease [Actinoplanes ovalisporus]MBM2618275.1 ABC transporter permease [Actinoplanes ovalisporus]
MSAATADVATVGHRLALQRRGTVAVLVLVVLLASLRYGDAFYSGINLTSYFDDAVKYSLIALGMTFVIMTGGIDLSVGSVILLAGVAGGLASPHGAVVAVLVGVGTGAAVGAVNGLLIAHSRLEPFVVTLATLLWARGLGLQLADTQTVVYGSGALTSLARDKIFGLTTGFWLMVVLFVIAAVVLKFTAWGRTVLAIGDSEESTSLLGVPTRLNKFSVYLLSGALAGLAGVVLGSQTGSVSMDTGVGWELIAVAAVVVGGTLLTGGVGSIGGTLAGLLLLQVIFTIINFENGRGGIEINSYWQNVVRGAFLLVVVLLQTGVGRGRKKS